MKRTVPADGGTATYVYCLVAGAPSLARVPAGCPEMGRPRLVPVADDVALVAATAPLGRYDEAAIERGLHDLDWVSRCAVAHERVIEHFLRAGATVVPMRLFTLFADDERACAHVRRRRATIGRVMRRVAGREEWGLRVRLDERKALRAVEHQARAEARDLASGTGFLLRKRRQHDAARQIADEAGDEADRIFAALSSQADDAVRRPPPAGAPGTALVLDAAFLVPSKAVKRFQAAARALAQRLAEAGYGFDLTGPWPPYHFVEPPGKEGGARSRGRATSPGRSSRKGR